MNPKSMTAVINRKRYSTDTATLLAGNDHWDGHNFERNGRNCFLYCTPKGSYFLLNMTCWEGELDNIEPLCTDEAVSAFEGLSRKRVKFEEAFPGVTVEEA
jgi:hypothetical protein